MEKDVTIEYELAKMLLDEARELLDTKVVDYYENQQLVLKIKQFFKIFQGD